MRKTINKVKVEGLVYENGIELKTVENPESANYGMQYYRGKLHVLTGKDNVVAVDFWENAKTKAGAPNNKFNTLTSFLSNLKTVVVDGEDVATPVSIGSSQMALNEWAREDGTLVSTPQNSGGFINAVADRSKLNSQASFELDVVVFNKFRGINPSTQEENDYLTVQATAFDFRGSILPITFSVFNPRGIEFFENMEPNTFTKIWGKQVSQVVITEQVTESAFGESLVNEVKKTTKHFVIDGCNTVAYPETDLTPQELQQALASRETHKSTIITKAQERKNAAPAINTNPAAGNPLGGLNLGGGNAASGAFNF